jgi:spore coat polysaccharide biosynthesis protein SpsF
MSPERIHRVVVIQARLESERRSGKGLALIGGKTLLHHVLERAVAIPNTDEVFVATTTRERDNDLESHVRELFGERITIIRGSSEDVQSRFTAVVEQVGSCNIARITADDPFKDPALTALGFELLEESNADYVSIGTAPIPLGMDIEVFSSAALMRSRQSFPTAENIEHVTIEMRQQDNFSRKSLSVPGLSRGESRLTVDYESDIRFTSLVAEEIERSGGGLDFITTLHALDTVEALRSERTR